MATATREQKSATFEKKKHFKVLFWSNFNKIKYFTYLRKHLYILQQWEAKSKCLSYPIFPLLFIDANWSIQMYRKYNVTTIVFPNLMILCWLKRHISKHPLYPFDWQYSFTSIFIKKKALALVSHLYKSFYYMDNVSSTYFLVRCEQRYYNEDMRQSPCSSNLLFCVLCMS